MDGTWEESLQLTRMRREKHFAVAGDRLDRRGCQMVEGICIEKHGAAEGVKEGGEFMRLDWAQTGADDQGVCPVCQSFMESS